MKKQNLSEEFLRMQKLAGILTESQMVSEEEEQVDELFGFGSKIEVTDKADKNKLVKVGTGDLVEYNPQYNNSGYATDNEGVYIIEKIKGDKVILKKAGNDYQSNQGKSSRDISGSIVKPSSLAYFGKK